MEPTYFPLRWESTGDHWWFASPIDWAAANGHYDLVRELLRLDGNHLIKLTSLRRIRRLETVWDDEEQFHDVATCRSHVARELLIECEANKGKNSLIHGGYGGWLLYTAASAGDLKFVRELLDRDPLIVFGEGEYGVTDILYAAARSKNSDVFRVVFDFAISPRFSSGVRKEGEEYSGEIPPAYRHEMMNRAVHAAARGGNLTILKELLVKCSDVSVYRDVQGATILHAAAGRGQVEVVKDLVASFDIIDSIDKSGNTALHLAASRGQLAVVEALIFTSPSLISSKNHAGETFLHMVITGFQTLSFRRLDHQIDLMKRLVAGKDFNINARNNDGRTALHLAIIGNIHSDLVELLMTADSIDVNIRDHDGMTPLDILKRRPLSESSEILTRQLVSAGGVLSSRDYSTRKIIASHLKMQNFGNSPGTSFRISDSEIFLYTGIENVSNGHGRVPLSAYSSDISEHESTVDIKSPRKGKKMASLAQRLNRLFHWSKKKQSKGEKEGTPIPLRERFSNTSSLPNNKRTLAVRSNLPSPNAKKKLASRVVRERSRSNSFSKSPFSSHGSLDKQKGIEIEDNIAIAGPSCSQEVNDDGFGFGLAGETGAYDTYEHSVLSTS